MTLDFIEHYADWTVEAWNSTGPLDNRDFAIMGLGLSGEVAEVADALHPVLEFGSPLDSINLAKELGDVIYYWARLCRAYDLSLHVMWPQGASEDLAKPELLLLRLVRHAGCVSEHVKKHIRDSSCERTTLALALFKTAKAWLNVCHAYGLSPQDVMTLNRAKVDDRRRRGVMAGSGDNR